MLIKYHVQKYEYVHLNDCLLASLEEIILKYSTTRTGLVSSSQAELLFLLNLNV